jgi:ABC-type sugar transport system substrate-binding protein
MKTMKKRQNLLALCMVMLLWTILAGCSRKADNSSTGTSTQPTNGTGKIGFSVITLGTEFFSTFDKELHARFEEGGYQVITLSCEANPVTQVSDIENLISMDVEAIILFVIDPTTITDVLKQARADGIKIYPIAAPFEDKDAYDAIIGTDQYATGTACAEMALDWVNANYSDAADGSIDTVILMDSTNQEGVARADGMKTIAELSPKINIVAVYDLAGATEMNLKAQEFAELAQGQHPNVKLVLSCSTGLGLNEVYMKDSKLDRSKFAIFGIDNTTLEYEAIKRSVKNESLVRGTVCMSRGMGEACWNVFIGAWDNLKDDMNRINEPSEKVTVENVGEFLK